MLKKAEPGMELLASAPPPGDGSVYALCTGLWKSVLWHIAYADFTLPPVAGGWGSIPSGNMRTPRHALVDWGLIIHYQNPRFRRSGGGRWLWSEEDLETGNRDPVPLTLNGRQRSRSPPRRAITLEWDTNAGRQAVRPPSTITTIRIGERGLPPRHLVPRRRLDVARAAILTAPTPARAIARH